MITKSQLKSFPHQGGAIVNPADHWIWLKPCRTAGTSIFRNLQPGWITAGSQYQPHEYRDWLRSQTDASLADYTVWTIVRNPYDRIISALRYFHIVPEDFFTDPITWLRDQNLRIHILPQYHYARHADLIGRFETLQESWDTIAAAINPPRFQVPHTNSSDRRPVHYRSRISPRHRPLIDALYATDLAELGYSF